MNNIFKYKLINDFCYEGSLFFTCAKSVFLDE